MAYRDNVDLLAAALCVSNNPALREEDIKVQALHFKAVNGQDVTIQGTNMNRGGRLFFQAMATMMGDSFDITSVFCVFAQEHFAELWESNPEPGKRKLLDAIRSSAFVRIERK